MNGSVNVYVEMAATISVALGKLELGIALFDRWSFRVVNSKSELSLRLGPITAYWARD